MVKCILVQKYIQENCYIFSNDKTNHCYIIDPGAQEDLICSYLDKNNLIPDKILLTHGHFDHIGAVNYLREKYQIDVYAFSDKYLLDKRYNLSFMYSPIKVLNSKVYNEYITLNDGSLQLEVIHTPGHTEDSVTLYSKECSLAFTGDTMFKNGFGNYTFPGGNEDILIDSILTKILTLPNDTIIYSGHGEVSEIEDEKHFYLDI